MDVATLVEVLRATLDPNRREEAEKQLETVNLQSHFCDVISILLVEGTCCRTAQLVASFQMSLSKIIICKICKTNISTVKTGP